MVGVPAFDFVFSVLATRLMSETLNINSISLCVCVGRNCALCKNGQ